MQEPHLETTHLDQLLAPSKKEMKFHMELKSKLEILETISLNHMEQVLILPDPQLFHTFIL